MAYSNLEGIWLQQVISRTCDINCPPRSCGFHVVGLCNFYKNNPQSLAKRLFLCIWCDRNTIILNCTKNNICGVKRYCYSYTIALTDVSVINKKRVKPTQITYYIKDFKERQNNKIAL